MPKKILLVEDYKDARLMYRRMLEEMGFSVVEADDGYEALEQFTKERPVLVLMDMALPGMDGLAATRHIKQERDVPVIGMTAHGNFYSEKAVEAGCDAVITKPVDLSKFESIISLYVEP